MTHNKPNKNNKHQKTDLKQQIPQYEEDRDDENVHIDFNQQNLQISAHEAQKYLDYLRKKVTHQIKDPFSLPFLNLKFQQLNSWKGATQQLNLQSRVYGLRVDNCHDGTIKLLNQVIINQQQQIIKEKMVDNDESQQEQQKKVHQKPCFHLQNAQKLSIKQGANFDKQSNSIWKIIFKKCENVAELQMNCIQLSQDFSLKLDCNDENIQFLNSQDRELTNQICRKLPKTQSLYIFQQIQVSLTQCVQQIMDLKARFKKGRKEQQDFKDFGFNLYNPFDENKNSLENGMLDYYSKLEMDQNQQSYSDKRDSNLVQDFGFHENLIDDNKFQHQQPLHINFNEVLKEINFIDDSQTDNQSAGPHPGQLYEPFNDMLYQTIKKAPPAKTKNNQNLPTLNEKRVRQRQMEERIIFNQLYEQKSLVFNTIQKEVNYLKQNNLLPINLVTLYENRNPFKKFKYIKKGRNKVQSSKYQPRIQNIYQTISQQIIQVDDTQMRLTFGNQFKTSFFQYQQSHFSQNQNINPFSQNGNQFVEFGNSQLNMNFRASKHKSIPIKALKTQIKKQLQYFSTKKYQNSILYLETSVVRQTQGTNNFKFQTQTHVINQQLGLKYLRGKMRNVDPLDIFTAMLHIAYEEQIVIRLDQKNPNSQQKICDLIMEQSY